MRNNSVGLVLTLALCLILMSCGTSTRNQRVPIPDVTPSSPETSSPPTSTAVSLPPKANIDFSGLRLLEVIFKTQLNVNRLDDLYATTRREISNLSVVSNCNLDVLKGFVATSWAPVVLLVSPTGGRHLWAVIGYDDATKQILLGNPVTRVTRSLVYADFEKEWQTGSARKCVLVTPGKLSEERVHSTLGKYLPPAQVAQVGVRSR